MTGIQKRGVKCYYDFAKTKISTYFVFFNNELFIHFNILFVPAIQSSYIRKRFGHLYKCGKRNVKWCCFIPRCF